MAVVDVSTESVQGSTAFLEHLAAGDFSTVETACNLNLHTLSTGTHGVGDSLLDGSAVGNLAFNLASHVVGHDGSIQLRLLHLVDVDLDFLIIEFLQLFLELVDILSALANDDSRTGCADSDGHELQGALNDNLRNAGLFQALVEILTDFLVFHQILAEALTAVPA